MGRALAVIGVPTGAGPYSAALEGLTALNEWILRQNPQTPALHASGVRYTREATDGWRDLTKVLATGSGDCEALSTWRAAELRVSGEDPNASVVVYRTGPKKFHAIVLRGAGYLEDPSVELGMKAPAGLTDTYAAWNEAIAAAPKTEDQPMVMGNEDVACAGIGANDDPYDVEVVYDVQGTDEGYRGVLRIPLVDGRAIFAQTSTSATPDEAAGKAHRVLGVIGSVWDDLAALAPSPQAQAAIRLARNEHVQNLAKGAYQAGKRVVGKGGGSGNGGGQRDQGLKQFTKRQRDAAAAAPTADAEYFPPGSEEGFPVQPDDPELTDDGQGFTPYDDLPAPQNSVVGLVEVNGVLCGIGEVERLGAVNEALARGSKPRIGAARSRSTSASRGGSGNKAGRSGGGGAGSGAARAMSGQPLPGSSSGRGGGASRATPQPPAGSPPPGFGSAQAPGGQPSGGWSPAFAGGQPPNFGSGPPAGFNAQSARSASLQTLQQNAAKAKLLEQGGGGGGGGGSGSGGGGEGFGGEYTTASDKAASEQADADLWAAYYGNQAQQQAQTAYFESAQEVSPDQFFGTVDPYLAEAMLADDSIPAQ